MKKLLLILAFIFSFLTINAQVYRYKANSFAIKYINEYGYWTDWSAWQSCDVTFTIDFDNDVIRIYSKSPQVYVVTKYVGNYSDYLGGKQTEFKVIDQDYDPGTIRIRIEPNGSSQLYVDFADISWVYGNVVKY